MTRTVTDPPFLGIFIAALVTASCVTQPSDLDEYVTLQRRSLSLDKQQIDNTAIFKSDAKVRRALVLASPGRTAEELEVARDELQKVLTTNAPQSAAVRDYLVLTLRYVEQRLTLYAKSKELTEKLQKLPQLEEQNQNLKAQLEQADAALQEAEKKLEALTRIEKSIERTNKDETK